MSEWAGIPGYAGRSARGAPDPQLRIGDAERNAVADALSQHYSEGRLDDGELKERLDRATGAKTRADLGGLLADLPPLAPAPPPVAAEHRHRWAPVWAVALVVLVLFSLPWTYLPGPWHPRVPWLLVGLVAFLMARRSRHRQRRSQLQP
ncbi:MAG: DUF1707 SHOCT-like domain-containing protein [Acidimicrobiales bacterium]